MKSKPSVSQTAPQVSNRSVCGAVVFLGFFCGFLSAGLVGLGVYYIVSIDKSAAKLSSVKVHLKDHLHTRCDQIFNLTADRERLNARVINVTEEVERLKTKNMKTVCPARWTLRRRRCYFFSTASASWTVSRSYCKRHGGDLVIINSIEEQRIIRTPTKDAYWIGLTDSELEGVWKWVDGSALTLSFWFLNQPDNGNGDPAYGEEDCGFVYYEKWNDFNCDKRHRFICEKPPILYEQF